MKKKIDISFKKITLRYLECILRRYEEKTIHYLIHEKNLGKDETKKTVDLYIKIYFCLEELIKFVRGVGEENPPIKTTIVKRNHKRIIECKN